MRFFFLILIIAYGVFVVLHTLSPVTYSTSSGHASASLNTLVFYLICAFFYLVVNKVKRKELVFLLIYSIIVIGFVARLISTLHQ
jgi:hypothetical protein